MATFAEDMKSRWAEETERLRSRSAQSASTDSSQGASDWIIGGVNGGVGVVRKRAHLTDPPNILGPAAERKPTFPLRGILKSKSSVHDKASASFSRYNDTEFGSTVADSGLDEYEIPGSFFLNELVSETDMEEEPDGGEPHLGPEIVLASNSHPRYYPTSTLISESHPVYEIFHPTGHDTAASTPRSASNVARLTQRFEGMEKGNSRIGKGKGKAGFVN